MYVYTHTFINIINIPPFYVKRFEYKESAI